MKIAVITPIPTPYRDAFWNEIASIPNVELHVLYCASGKADRPWKNAWKMNYHHHFLRGWNLMRWKSRESSHYLNLSVFSQLKTIKPNSILIGGYNHTTMLLAMWWAVNKGIAFYLMCETYQFKKGNNIGAFFKNQLLKIIAKKSKGGFPTGEAAARYLTLHGWNKSTLCTLPNVPDIANIRKIITQNRKNSSVLKSKWKVNNENIILFVGRLVKKKNLDYLLKALVGIESELNPKLIIIGDGDERSNLILLSQQLGIDHLTNFLGFLEPNEILEWFSLSRVFCLPSNETWGVAPIEAASAGLDLILSEKVGSAFELSKRYPKIQMIKEGHIPRWKKAISDVLSSKNESPSNRKDESISDKNLQEWGYHSLASKTISFLDSNLNRN